MGETRMQCKSLDSRIYAELTSLNAGLLRILVSREAADRTAPLGLAPAILGQLRELLPAELDFIAGTPVLLAGFEAPEPAGRVDRIADVERPLESYGIAAVGLTPGGPCDGPLENQRSDPWSRMTRLFAAALLTWLWQVDRRDQLITALCIGPGDRLPPLSVPLIESLAGLATQRLRVRFGAHPRFWPDMVRAARSRDAELRALSRLAVLPLVLAEECCD